LSCKLWLVGAYGYASITVKNGLKIGEMDMNFNFNGYAKALWTQSVNVAALGSTNFTQLLMFYGQF
jgi:hypothetical protein